MYRNSNTSSLRVGVVFQGAVCVLALSTYFTVVAQILDAPPTVDKQIHSNIPYYSEDEQEELGIDDVGLVSLDLYEPMVGESLPIVAYVHGGGWRRGDKKAVHYKPDFFLANGFVFASLNCRLLPDVEIETLQNDVAGGIA